MTLCLFCFAIILTRKRELAALLLLSFGYHITVNVLYLFLTLSWVGLQFVIVVFHDHTHLLFVCFIFVLLLTEGHNEGGVENNTTSVVYVNGPPVFMADAEGSSNYEELEDTTNSRNMSHTYDEVTKEDRQ